MKTRFTVEGWRVESENTVVFSYSCSSLGNFSEVVTFPVGLKVNTAANQSDFSLLMNLAACIIGVSYYKAACAHEVCFKTPLTEGSVEVAKAVYTDGLGEFFARNSLKFPPDIGFFFELAQPNFEYAETTLRAVHEPNPTVAFGGGKDSHAAIELLKRSGCVPHLVSVTLSDNVSRRLFRMTDEPLKIITRRIDERLLVLNRDGAVLNGHVPITAINSILLTLYAYVKDSRWVVFANERGASVPTQVYQGADVNHQYSKSLGFEYLFRRGIAEAVGDRVQYFSILRPFSELWIAAFVAREAQSSRRYMASCNRNFVFAGPAALPADVRWCGKCSKCVYTATIMAPHLTPVEMQQIFECEVLDSKENLPVAEELCGLSGAKPWECVGDMDDTFAAMHYLSHDPTWSSHALPSLLRGKLDSKQDYRTSESRFISELRSRSTNFLPNSLSAVALPAEVSS
jgi:hypothetical protein